MDEFPVDDVMLDCLEHAMKGAYTIDEDGTHRLVGADYSMNQLLDFVGGTYDPPDLAADDNPALIRQDDIAGIPCYEDIREHYTRDDVIRALVKEVRSLRNELSQEV